MEITEVMKLLGIPATQKNKLVKRYQKIGILLPDGTVSDEDVRKILQDAEEHVDFNRHVTEAVSGTGINGPRAVSDIRSRLVYEEVSIPKFSDTTFSVTPNVYYVHRDLIPKVDEMIGAYLEAYRSGAEFKRLEKRRRPQAERKHGSSENKKKEQQKKWLGIVDFLSQHEGWDAYVRKKNHRENALFYIEDNEHFDLDIMSAEEVIFEKTKNNPYYIRRADLQFWEGYMSRFFEEYGLNGRQRLEKILARCSGRDTFTRLKEFLGETDVLDGDIPPRVADVAWVLAEQQQELKCMDLSDVSSVIENISTQEGRRFMVMFANWLSEREWVAYPPIIPVYTEGGQVQGYSWEQYKAMCHLVLNEEHITAMGMVRKALSDIQYAGMWMYHSIMLLIPVRGTDAEQICSFMELHESPAWLKGIPREADELEWAVLEGRISENEYQSIGKWFIDRIDYCSLTVSKTQREEVRARITPSLLEHFGRLFLIEEVHHMRGKEEFLNIERWKTTYGNRYFMAGFYGDDVIRILEGKNFQRLRMNHTILQMEKQAARDMGMDAYTAVSVMAYSRGHTNHDTMYHYIGDHALTGEDADTVLWLMMERGVLSSVPYLMLISCFPETFGRMPAAEQTRLMSMAGITPVEVEVLAAKKERVSDLREVMLFDADADPAEVLKPLLAIAQGYGTSMDDGCYCLKRAAGQKCERETRGGCLSSGCRLEVLTQEAIPAIGRLVREKRALAENTEDTLAARKAKAVLNRNILPNLKGIIKHLRAELPEAEYLKLETRLKYEMEVSP